MNEIQSVVSSEWLAGQLGNLDIVIVDCRFQLADPQWGEKQYQRSHIPGAYYLDLEKDLSARVARHGGRHPLPAPDLLAQKLTAIGISSKSWVVAYDDSRFAFASRLWWLLRYLGHERVALLDGGWQDWLAHGYPVSEAISTPRSGHFSANPQSDWIVDLEIVKAKKDLSSVILIDSRDGDRYRGEREPIDPIAGHIPGAQNSPWQLVSDERGYFQPLERQQQLWANYQQADEIIVYCGSGVTACVNLFSWELVSLKSAEMVKAKLYPGGWSDWCSYLT
jgi:thiosulfate/3-mercaptopyruvate sulfurtransferase